MFRNDSCVSIMIRLIVRRRYEKYEWVSYYRLLVFAQTAQPNLLSREDCFGKSRLPR